MKNFFLYKALRLTGCYSNSKYTKTKIIEMTLLQATVGNVCLLRPSIKKKKIWHCLFNMSHKKLRIKCKHWSRLFEQQSAGFCVHTEDRFEEVARLPPGSKWTPWHSEVCLWSGRVKRILFYRWNFLATRFQANETDCCVSITSCQGSLSFSSCFASVSGSGVIFSLQHTVNRVVYCS